MKTSRIILHIDMNCFFASCEIAENEELRGKPIVVAREDPFQRSIILSPSYEARKFGIKTTMRVNEAFKLCKDIVVVEPNYEIYEYYSEQFHNYLLSITNKVEMASIDEAYLDVSELENIPQLAKNMQDHILNNIGLPSSIGIAPNKFLAKMASDMKKPLGITILRKREIDKLLWPLPITDMFGVGKKTAPKLKEIGINTIGDLANYHNISLLKKTIGEQGTKFLLMASNGNDDSLVDFSNSSDTESVSNAHTFSRNIFEEYIIKNEFKVICNTVSYRLQEQNVKASTIGIQIKFSDFRNINRSKALDQPVNNESTIYRIVLDLFEENFHEGEEVRLIGVSATRFTPVIEEVKQLSIFDNLSEVEKKEELKKILNSIKDGFGKDSIKQGYYKYKNENEKND